MSAASTEVRLAQLQADADRCGPEARKLFDRLIKEGKTPEAAAMYACQQAPGTRGSDRAFCDGQRRKMENMTPWLRKRLQDDAKKAGINTNGRYYVGGLGKPTDPAAWVTSSDDVLTVCKARNYDCDGVIRHKAIAKEKPTESIRLAPRVIRDIEKKMLRQDPALAERVRKNKYARRELHEQIMEKHARKKTFKKSNRLLKSS